MSTLHSICVADNLEEIEAAEENLAQFLKAKEDAALIVPGRRKWKATSKTVMPYGAASSSQVAKALHEKLPLTTAQKEAKKSSQHKRRN